MSKFDDDLNDEDRDETVPSDADLDLGEHIILEPELPTDDDANTPDTTEEPPAPEVVSPAPVKATTPALPVERELMVPSLDHLSFTHPEKEETPTAKSESTSDVVSTPTDAPAEATVPAPNVDPGGDSLLVPHSLGSSDDEGTSYPDLPTRAHRHEQGTTQTSLDNELDQTKIRRRSLATPTPAAQESDPFVEQGWRPREDTLETSPDRMTASAGKSDLDSVLFDGASMDAQIPTRGVFHTASFFLHLLIIPAIWFLLADAGNRLLGDNVTVGSAPSVNLIGIVEIISSLVFIGVLTYLTVKSSLGAWVSGIVLLTVGIPWIIIPKMTYDLVHPGLASFATFNAFTAKLSQYIMTWGFTGLFFALGFCILCVGIISHATRRSGRFEEKVRARVQTVNPKAAYFTRRERRRAMKAGRRDEAS